jgi:hypothetical protein
MVQYWIRNNGFGDYCIGDPRGEVNILLVTERPEDSIYNWNKQTNRWETTLDLKKQYLKGLQCNELRRTDKCLLLDMYPKFTAEQQSQILAYRQSLRTFLNVETVEEIIIPICPEFIKEPIL